MDDARDGGGSSAHAAHTEDGAIRRENCLGEPREGADDLDCPDPVDGALGDQGEACHGNQTVDLVGWSGERGGGAPLAVGVGNRGAETEICAGEGVGQEVAGEPEGVWEIGGDVGEGASGGGGEVGGQEGDVQDVEMIWGVE